MAAIAESFLDLCTAHEAPEGIAKQHDLLVQMNHKRARRPPSLAPIRRLRRSSPSRTGRSGRSVNLPTKLTGAMDGRAAECILHGKPSGGHAELVTRASVRCGGRTFEPVPPGCSQTLGAEDVGSSRESVHCMTKPRLVVMAFSGTKAAHDAKVALGIPT